jgi:hypothetical protein
MSVSIAAHQAANPGQPLILNVGTGALPAPAPSPTNNALHPFGGPVRNLNAGGGGPACVTNGGGLPVGRLTFNNPVTANSPGEYQRGTPQAGDAGSQMVALFQQVYSLTWEQAVAAARATDEMIRKQHGAAAAPAPKPAPTGNLGPVPNLNASAGGPVRVGNGGGGLQPSQISFANPLDVLDK